jgi:hypothetical protein
MSTADDYYIYGRSEERLSANVLCSYAQTRPLLTVHRCGLRQWRARAGRLPQTAPEARGPRACALLLRRRALSCEMSPAQKMLPAKESRWSGFGRDGRQASEIQGLAPCLLACGGESTRSSTTTTSHSLRHCHQHFQLVFNVPLFLPHCVDVFASFTCLPHRRSIPATATTV